METQAHYLQYRDQVLTTRPDCLTRTNDYVKLQVSWGLKSLTPNEPVQTALEKIMKNGPDLGKDVFEVGKGSSE